MDGVVEEPVAANHLRRHGHDTVDVEVLGGDVEEEAFHAVSARKEGRQ